MKNLLTYVWLGLVGLAAAAEVKIEVLVPKDCDRKTQAKDIISMHYKGSLLATGEEFDSSHGGSPFTFRLGVGQVIPGWEQGALDMCPGEKRRVTIPPELGYGDEGVGPIPGGSTLVFETELVSIDGKADGDSGDMAGKVAKMMAAAAERAEENRQKEKQHRHGEL